MECTNTVLPCLACLVTAIGVYVAALAGLNLLLLFALFLFIIATVSKRCCSGIPMRNASGSTLFASMLGNIGLTIW